MYRQTLPLFPYSHLQHRIGALRIMSILSVSPSLVVPCHNTHKRAGLVIVVEQVMVFTAENIPAMAQVQKGVLNLVIVKDFFTPSVS